MRGLSGWTCMLLIKKKKRELNTIARHLCRGGMIYGVFWDLDVCKSYFKILCLPPILLGGYTSIGNDYKPPI